MPKTIHTERHVNLRELLRARRKAAGLTQRELELALEKSFSNDYLNIIKRHFLR